MGRALSQTCIQIRDKKHNLESGILKSGIFGVTLGIRSLLRWPLGPMYMPKGITGNTPHTFGSSVHFSFLMSPSLRMDECADLWFEPCPSDIRSCASMHLLLSSNSCLLLHSRSALEIWARHRLEKTHFVYMHMKRTPDKLCSNILLRAIVA